ncbi:family 16 glycosylhydrolase [Pelagibius litoralis]|uniref:Family 16 glycosylhydrolase n=1 Tax=Pelagibius litoralis TaxID=374515 RepID=A0A967F1A5_9PROT|nr:family 16 glycosylhydrolase [Pelagibius litoralis]NIA71227.1 family 16 glycosylhydrolase [Pelagibius litoralis]
MSTVLNARGIPLSYSASSVNSLSATDSGPQLSGTAENDSFWGDPDFDVTMSGLAGDDIYHIYSSNNRAVEAAGDGIDSVDTWMSFTLPAHIENLTVTGAERHAYGNGADNIISGGDGQQTIDGRGGDDVLAGAGGADIFVVEKGNGSDLIRDFGADDVVRLTGYDFTSFGGVQERMTQSGSDARLDLGDGEILVFAGKTVDQFNEKQFNLNLDRSKLTLSFEDNFNSLNLWDGESGTWDSNYWWGQENGSTLENNDELQWYIDHDYGPTRGVNPFSVDDGVLTITAAEAPDGIRSQINGYEFTSGMLTSYESFTQTYGYYEIRADMPGAQGLWPAFWLLPADGSWPEELDVVETRGQNPNELILTAHSNASGSHVIDARTADVADAGDGFHNYGVRWGPETITWYYDGVEVARTDTPADMHEPMYMIFNLAVGGIAGRPGDNLATPGEMKVDYVRAYTLDGVEQGQARDLSGNDTLVSAVGRDVYDGGGGDDTIDYSAASAGRNIDLTAGTATYGNTSEALVSIENAVGGSGNDTVIGDAADNVLAGGGGSDRLVGREGDDRLTGGQGADTFHFRQMDQANGDDGDRITDFQREADVLSFSDLIDSDGDADIDLDDLVGSVASVNDTGAGNDVTVSFDNGASLTLADAGTGEIDSVTDLVRDAETQIQVS